MNFSAADAEWEARFNAAKMSERQALEARSGQPPRRSQVGGPPADWKRWVPLLDDCPVEDCYAYDVDEGWVEVWVVDRVRPPGSGTCRLANVPRRRLSGQVAVVSLAEWNALRQRRKRIVVTLGDERGEPVPGTELRG